MKQPYLLITPRDDTVKPSNRAALFETDMKNNPQQSILGVGPWLAIVGVVMLLLVLCLYQTLGFSIRAAESHAQWMRAVGLCWGAIGLWFWIGSVILVVRVHSNSKLVTNGVYRYSRNPMYAAFIVFLIPALSFISNNLMTLSVSVVMFAAFKILIRKEEVYLQTEFGEEYEQYTKRVAQLIPFIRI
ncbi:MAG TPA: isoprenylcysteine carboxylmethyltransferase family protein [Dissulfurispiraceae bacterium]|nr:isoprenylcysteine carboxylmethyltransferase family protein [Dissulfurispiraceae bacterium]